jgi:outer membrane protein TolC
MSLKYCKTLVLILAVGAVHAQEFLSLNQALESALEFNHDLAIAERRLEVAENLATPGQANLLPTITANAAGTHAQQNFISTTFADGRVIEGNDAISQNLTGSVVLNYNLFNGFNRYYTFKRLKRQEDLSEAELRFALENTLQGVISAYLEVARLEQNQRVQAQSLAISLDRYARVKAKTDLGGGNRIEMLNAAVDLSADSVAWIGLDNQLNNAKRNLMVLMGQDPRDNFQVDTLLPPPAAFDYQQMREQALGANSNLEQAEIRQEAARMDAEALKGGYYPQLDLQAGYAGTLVENQKQFIVDAVNYGWNAGLVFRWTLFNGTRTRTAVQNARLNLEVAREVREQTRKNLLRDFDNAYTGYNNALFVQGVEQRTLQTAQLNFERTRELFGLGQVNNTQFREAQLNLARTLANYNNARYSAKLAEVQLLRLSGQLAQMVTLQP